MGVYSLITLIVLSLNYSPSVSNYSLTPRGIRDSAKNVVVIHYDAGESPQTTLKYLRRSGKSYHFYITRTGKIIKLMDTKYVAYHAGVSEWNTMTELNHFSIGICFQNVGSEKFTMNQYLSGSWLIDKLKDRYPDINKLNVVGHEDVAYPRGRKPDPGDNFNWNILFTLLDIFNSA